jgi:hypothetical protein
MVSMNVSCSCRFLSKAKLHLERESYVDCEIEEHVLTEEIGVFLISRRFVG